MKPTIENIPITVEGQIDILLKLIEQYAPILAPSPKICKIDYTKLSKLSNNPSNCCSRCNKNFDSFYLWPELDINPFNKQITILSVQDVCTLCLNILDLNTLVNSLLRDDTSLYTHFLQVNGIDPLNQMNFQHCITIVMNIQALSREINWNIIDKSGLFLLKV